MKKITKLVAVSAAAMTFGITGVSALNNTNVVNADSASDLANLNSQIQDIKNGKDKVMLNDQVGSDAENVSTSASDVQNGTSKNFKDTLGDVSWYHLGNSVQDDDKVVAEDVATMKNMYAFENDQTGLNQVTSLGQATEKVLGDFYGSNAQPATQSANNSNKQNANANKQTASNDNKQNTNNANAQNANNNNNANVQSNSSNKKADVAANADNNNAKNNAQGAVANKQNTNNEVNAQQNTTKSNANVEGPKTVANENTTAAGETSTVVKAQAKSSSNSAAQKNNTPVFPQTGEQASEILAVAGGLIIAATAAGIVVYKKRN